MFINNYEKRYCVCLLLTIFEFPVIYVRCTIERTTYSMNNLIHDDVCDIIEVGQIPETIENLCIKLIDSDGDDRKHDFIKENSIMSPKLMCNALETTKLFTKTSDVLIITSKQLIDTFHTYLETCTGETVPYRLWIPPDRFDGKYIAKNIERWINNGIQKFVIFCLLECTSLILGSLSDFPGVNYQPVFFIFDRQILFLSISLPKLVIAVEEPTKHLLEKSINSR